MKIRAALPQICAAILVLTSAAVTRAQTVTYTFEQFRAPDYGTFANVAPEVGGAVERATFNAADTSVYSIGTVFGPISGNLLVTSSHTMQITLTAPVTSINVAFAGIGTSCSIVFSSTVGTTTVNANTSGGYGFATGQLTFASAKPFTTFTLSSNASYWGIDNLILSLAHTNGPSPVPDAGSTATLLGIAIAALAIGQRRLALR